MTIDDYIDEQIEIAKDEELEMLNKRKKQIMDGEYTFGGYKYKKPSEYISKPKTREERLQEIEEVRLMKLAEIMD